MILTVRTTRGREKTVLEALRIRMENLNLKISCIFYPQDLKGYLFVEGEEEDIEELVRNIRHVRGIIKKPVPLSELEHFLSEEIEEIDLNKGDVVEVISGPFKDEEARVRRVDKANKEVVIELLEAAVPIPITIKINLVRKK